MQPIGDTTDLHRPTLALCSGCGELGLLPHVHGMCWLCGGWEGLDYPEPDAGGWYTAARGYGFGFFGGHN